MGTEYNYQFINMYGTVRPQVVIKSVNRTRALTADLVTLMHPNFPALTSNTLTYTSITRTAACTMHMHTGGKILNMEKVVE